jgi:hypothetical protein
MNPFYASVIGISLLQPIVSLLKNFPSDYKTEGNDFQVTHFENSHCSAIILLTVVMFEATINRARLVDEIYGRIHALDYLNKHHKGRFDIDDLEEVFVIRDVIAHNHIWKAEVNPATMSIIEAKRLDEYGDAKFNRVVDQATRKTKRFGLHVLPTRIGFDDAKIVIKAIVEALKTLESVDSNYVSFYPPTPSSAIEVFKDYKIL